MLRTLYNVLWYPALPMALLAAGVGSRRDRRERMGLHVHPLDGGPRIWMHAASVGEVEAMRPVAAGLMRELAGAQIVVTTMTTTGRDAARRRIAGAAACALAPLDCPAVVRKFLRTVRPDLVLVGETELWPNYFIEARRAGARVAIVNGRISRRSARRYRRARSLFAHALQCADLVLAQSHEDARRFAVLGAPRERIHVTGNTKFDLSVESAEAAPRPALIAFAAGHPLLVAGSTGRGEEAVALQAWQALRQRFPELALVLAPRHPARAPEVAELLRAAAVGFVKASTLDSVPAPPGTDVMLLDTMGELRSLYACASVAFVGGSLFAGRGGQNVAEPAVCAVPVLFGPFHENQREMASSLLGAGGAAVVRDANELIAACARWLGDEHARVQAGISARTAAEEAGDGARTTLIHLRALAGAA